MMATGRSSTEHVVTAKMIALVALSALAATGASAQAVLGPHLSGSYQCVQNCAGAGLAHITQSGWELNLTNEIGQSSKARIDSPGHIWVESWNEGAVYPPGGMTIQFNRGSVWVLVVPMSPGRGY